MSWAQLSQEPILVEYILNLNSKNKHWEEVNFVSTEENNQLDSGK